MNGKTFLFFCVNLILISFSNIAAAELVTAMDRITEGLEGGTAATNVPYDYITDSFISDDAKRNGTQTRCDVLTANKRDPKRKAYPVKFSDIKASKAISACRQALKAEPSNPRLMLNMGRAFNKLKVYDQSFLWTKKASEANYPFAYRVMALHYKYGEGVEKNRDEQVRFLNLAINEDIDSASADLAELELDKTITHIDFSMVEKLIKNAGYYQDSSSALWGYFYLRKSKAMMQSHFFMNWKEILAANDVDKIVTRLNPTQEREYLNLLDSALGHYSDYLSSNKDKKISTLVNKLEQHKRYYVSELKSH
mgnify:FL=1